jgi:hypothetical protein
MWADNAWPCYLSEMTRWVLVITGLGWAAMAASAGAQACALPHSLVATQVGRVWLNHRVLNVAALSIPAADAEDHSRLIVRDAHCRVQWTATVDGLENRFDVRRLGSEDVLQFVSLEPAGDGTGFTHRLLAFRGRRLRLVSQFRHTGKDGFYLGPLARGGEGVVTWVADASGESEASPHPYVISTWTWRGGRLVGPAHYGQVANTLLPTSGRPGLTSWRGRSACLTVTRPVSRRSWNPKRS